MVPSSVRRFITFIAEITHKHKSIKEGGIHNGLYNLQLRSTKDYFCEVFEIILPTILLLFVPEVKVSDLCNLPGLFVVVVVVVWEEVAVPRSHVVPSQYWPPSRDNPAPSRTWLTCVTVLYSIYYTAQGTGRLSKKKKWLMPCFYWREGGAGVGGVQWRSMPYFSKVFLCLKVLLSSKEKNILSYVV